VSLKTASETPRGLGHPPAHGVSGRAKHVVVILEGTTRAAHSLRVEQRIVGGICECVDVSSIWFGAVLPGLIGSLVLFALYRLLQIRWPASYYSVDDLLSRAVSRSLRRYVAFRFGPVYATGVIVAEASARPVGAASVFCLLHLLLTILPGFLGAVRSRSSRRQRITIHSLVALGVIVTVAAASATAPLLGKLLPDPGEYIENLLTSVFTVIAFFVLSGLAARTSPRLEGSELLARLDPRVVDAVIQSAAHHKVDRDFALTLTVVESLQRPTWVAPAERILGRLRIARTFGPLQGSRSRGASAAADVDEALRRLSPTILTRSAGSSYIPSVILQFNLERHNSSGVFIEMGEEAFRSISQEIEANTETAGDDGSPALRIIKKERVGEQWVLVGDASAEFEEFHGQTQSAGAGAWRDVPTSQRPGRYRPLWQARCSIYDERFVIDAWRQGQTGDAVRLETYL
jgi:hypothetical protein